ncbi:MAG TPA: AsmA-like C-terminal region-containing protein, partial [Flavobacteriales bacterium]|nr:AsmA-like C-terminal region-containing protein [Flavobacteriales bacterium]
LNGSLRNDSLVVDGVDYINDKDLDFNISVERINSDSIFIRNSSLSIGGVNFKDLNFEYLNSEYFLKVETAGYEDISNVIFATPKEYQYLYEDHEISGKISANILIRKEKNFENPYSEIDFKLNNCKYKSETQPFELENIYSDCHFDNDSTKRSFDFTKFVFSNFKSSKKGGEFNGDFTISNLNKYYLESQIFSSWNLRELNAFIEDSPFKNLKGTVSGKIEYQGNLSFDSDTMSGYFAKSTRSKGDLYFRNVFFNYEESELDFIFKKMNWKVDNHNVKISKNDFKVSQSELSFDGEIDNLILYVLDQKKKIDVAGELSSEKMIFEELFTITEINDDEEDGIFVSVLPTWLDVNISVHAKEFWYDNFNASNLTGNVNYNSKKLKLSADKIHMKTLDGSIFGDISYLENRLHDLVLKSNLEINKINISDGFKSFDNFKQTFMTHKNIKGTATANIYLQAMWDRNYKFYSPSLYMSAQLKIENGELIKFEPMYSLSKYVSLEELKEVKFATLENKIRIEKEKIIIPEMDINSTALSVHFSGNHSFDNIMDYKVRLLLSDVLGNKVKESMSLEEMEHNHEGKTTVQLKMSGHLDDLKISLDKVKIKEDIAKEILKEGEEVIKIIENKILNKETPEKEEEENLDIEIEWDDENPKI